MPLFGKISEFQDGQESFLNYEERLVQFFEANEVPDEKLVPVFLSVIGSTAYGVLKNLVAPALPKDKSYADLVKLLKNHYNPKPLTISERFKFNKRNQKEGETVSEYVVELKRLSTHCDFGTFLNDALRDRFVCGLRSETIQKKLLAEEELSFDQAIKISTAMEMAEKDTVSLVEPAVAKNTNFVEESSDEELTLFVYSNSESKSNHPFKVNFMLDNEDVLFELDTGSSRTLINEQTYRAQLGGNNLRPTNIKLKSYSGQSIDTLGEITVSSEGKLLTAVVVKGNRPNLLGRDWLKQIKLDWKTIFASVNKVDSSDPVETMKQKFSEVFVKNDKPILGFKATIHLKENSKPWFHKARPVPYALKDKVTEELKILEKDGVIERVDNSSWASPLVVVPKADKKSLRLCGDYKVSVNREISEDQYPLPNIDDMFATLAGSVMDTVLAGLSGVVCRIDDILITAPSDDVHLQRLEEVLRRLHTHNIKLNANKCVFMAKNVVFMGHLVDEEGIHPTDDKVEAVMKAPVPTDVGTLKSYLGLLNYYGSFIPNLSTMLHPLHQLLRKGAKWEWSAECQEAFDRSKDELSGTGVLIHYDEQKPVILACDASAYGVGQLSPMLWKMERRNRLLMLLGHLLQPKGTILSGWPKHNDDPKIRPYFSKRFELGVDRGVLLWGLRVIIPETLRNTILSELHDQHLGVNRMKSLARGYVWWPNLDSELEHLAATCGTCQSLKALPAEAPLHPWVRASRPMERIHIDFADFKNHSFLILIDNYSKWLEVIPMKSTTSENTIDKLRSIFSYTGYLNNWFLIMAHSLHQLHSRTL
ncbi:uncharacterized protein K02A2.6-like [Mercenaria mercenaria]|uniref:uncharacterized protein K02A2.6-like n=1 Tax=Mercenaria mercenaria TaxID=6596 RepID=UPI00234F4DB1|nr:uncharacterized protein K02A2.6-like [Mercenaria mercenaria]